MVESVDNIENINSLKNDLHNGTTIAESTRVAKPLLKHQRDPDDSKENESPARKRAKKTKEEKELEQLQREEEKKQRQELEAEKKRLREEERKKKEEERELKRLQREQEQKQKEKKKEEERLRREEEKRQKEEKREEERKRKEEEKHKELRQQRSIASFFSKKPKSRESEVLPVKDDVYADYERYFLPFHVKANTEWITFENDRDPETAMQEMDNHSNTADLIDWLAANARPDRGRTNSYKACDVINALNQGFIDEATAMERLYSIPYKHLQFAEDIRPPYIGTYSKDTVPQLATDPWACIVADLRYDYDSEMEWVQEDEEEGGEDLGDEDSEDALDEDDEDMDEFLAADDDVPRRQFIGELKPLILWKNGDQEEEEQGMFDKMQVELLCNVVDGPIDPFRDYWKPDRPRQTVKPSSLLLDGQQRPPEFNSPKKLVPSDCMTGFLQKVHGSDMNKILLVEMLKKDFPSVSKEAIRNTITLYARRMGDKETDKRWAINDDARKLFHLL